MTNAEHTSNPQQVSYPDVEPRYGSAPVRSRKPLGAGVKTALIAAGAVLIALAFFGIGYGVCHASANGGGATNSQQFGPGQNGGAGSQNDTGMGPNQGTGQNDSGRMRDGGNRGQQGSGQTGQGTTGVGPQGNLPGGVASAPATAPSGAPSAPTGV